MGYQKQKLTVRRNSATMYFVGWIKSVQYRSWFIDIPYDDRTLRYRDNGVTARHKRAIENFVGMAPQRLRQSASLCLPDIERLVIRGRDNPFPIRTDSAAVDCPRM